MKRFSIIFITLMLALFGAIGLSACGGDSASGGTVPSAWKRYNDSINYRLSYTSEDECPNGNIKDGSLHASVDFEVGEVYYMVVDFTISSFNANGWDNNFSSSIKISPITVISATLEEAATGNFTEEEEGDAIKITTMYRIPEDRNKLRNYRFTIKLFLLKDVNWSNAEFVYIPFYGDRESEENVSYAEDYISMQSLRFQLNNGGKSYRVIGSFNRFYSLVIPSTYNGYPVTSIGSNAFADFTELNNVYIPDSVTSIGNYAFAGCSELKNITIPDSVSVIGLGAFFKCNGLEYISLPFVGSTKSLFINTHFGYIFGAQSYTKNSDCVPDSLDTVVITGSTVISDYAFMGCSEITNITIADNVTTIGNYAFSGCSSLTNITIPDSVISIGSYAISATAYYANEINWNNNALYIGNHLIIAKTDIEGSYSINSGTRTIAASAFLGCSGLTSITIPASVTSIGLHAFKECNSLVSIELHNTQGWSVSWYPDMGDATSISSDDLADSTIAAQFFTNRYLIYYWHRS